MNNGKRSYYQNVYALVRTGAQAQTTVMKQHQKSKSIDSQAADRPSSRLERRGDAIVLGQSCVNTASGVQADYRGLSWEIRKVEQHIQQNHRSGTAADILLAIKRDFPDTILVGNKTHPGYATDADLKELIANPHQTPSNLAVHLIAEKVGLTEATVRTYTKQRKR